MQAYLIEGRATLAGEITPAGNKNAAFPLIAAALLTDARVTLHNMPDIGDVRVMLEIVESLGVSVRLPAAGTVTLCAAGLTSTVPDAAEFSRLRGALVLMGPLLARLGEVQIPQPGGDRIGRRRIDTHVLALERLGARFDMPAHGTCRLHARQLTGAHILLDETSVTGTENAVLAAVLANGRTEILNAASEPHVQDLCHLLNAMGASIDGIGSNRLVIHGVDSLGGAEYRLGPDYMEVGSLIALGAVTPGEIRIRDAAPEQLHMTLHVLGRLGITTRIDGNDVIVPEQGRMVIEEDIGGVVHTVSDMPWPGFAPDLMSVALVAATQCEGTVLFHERMYESRLFFVDRLISMGARIILCDPHRAVVQGPCRLRGETAGISSPDIRAGIALLIAALCAEGRTVIRNIAQIDRGYERLEQRLLALGARIERVDD